MTATNPKCFIMIYCNYILDIMHNIENESYEKTYDLWEKWRGKDDYLEWIQFILVKKYVFQHVQDWESGVYVGRKKILIQTCLDICNAYLYTCFTTCIQAVIEYIFSIIIKNK